MMTPPVHAWDAFLESTPQGQFQQASGWARVKAEEGWQVLRLGLAAGAGPSWGAQILWKETRPGRVGYVSKGPVLAEESPATIATALTHLRQAARQLGLRALVVQPPDESRISAADLCRQGFSALPLPGVISATALVDLRGGPDAFEARMNRRTRQEARQAVKRGVTVRWGARADLPLFFELMRGSCRRQNTAPNPGRVEILEALWDAFPGRIQIGFAHVQEEAVASLLLIGFGSRCTFWKKGWNSQEAVRHANCLLNVAALRRAADQGYRFVDFGALDRPLAEALLAGQPPTPAQLQSRHTFNLRLGAQPKLLPPAQLLVLNPVLRGMVNVSSRCRPLGRWLFRALSPG